MKIKELYFIKLLIYIYKRFFEKEPLILFFLIALFFNIFSWILVSFKGRPENYLIPIHYLSIKGVTKIGQWYEIYKIPFFGLILLIVNFFIIFLLRKKSINDFYILAIATILLEVFFTITSFLLVFRV